MKYKAWVSCGALQHMESASFHAHERKLCPADSEASDTALGRQIYVDGPCLLVGEGLDCENARIELAVCACPISSADAVIVAWCWWQELSVRIFQLDIDAQGLAVEDYKR